MEIRLLDTSTAQSQESQGGGVLCCGVLFRKKARAAGAAVTASPAMTVAKVAAECYSSLGEEGRQLLEGASDPFLRGGFV